MAALRRSTLARLAIPIVVAVVGSSLPARAGVRVTDLYRTEPDAPRRETSMTPMVALQVGGGLTAETEGDLVAESWTVAAEASRWSHLSLFARAEGFTFEERGDAIFFEVVARARTTLLEAGLRWNESNGTVRMYGQACGGVALVHATIAILPTSIVITDDVSLSVLDVGVGGAWQPWRSPLGMFGEVRTLFFFSDGRTSDPTFPVRAGMQIAWRR